MNKRRVFAVILSALFVLCVLFAFAPAAKADALDEILVYAITVDVNEDGTLIMHYHFDWKVLDSTSEGPLSWIKIGIPNTNVIAYEAQSDTIKEIKIYNSGGVYVRTRSSRSTLNWYRITCTR